MWGPDIKVKSAQNRSIIISMWQIIQQDCGNSGADLGAANPLGRVPYVFVKFSKKLHKIEKVLVGMRVPQNLPL